MFSSCTGGGGCAHTQCYEWVTQQSVTDSVGRLSVRRQEHPEVTADNEESRKEDRI